MYSRFLCDINVTCIPSYPKTNPPRSPPCGRAAGAAGIASPLTSISSPSTLILTSSIASCHDRGTPRGTESGGISYETSNRPCETVNRLCGTSSHPCVSLVHPCVTLARLCGTSTPPYSHGGTWIPLYATCVYRLRLHRIPSVEWGIF